VDATCTTSDNMSETRRRILLFPCILAAMFVGEVMAKKETQREMMGSAAVVLYGVSSFSFSL
jgi:hypothetical protein